MHRTAACLIAAAVAAVAAARASAEAPLRSRTFRFTYTATVEKLPPGSHTLDLWLPYPQSDENQTIQNVTVRAPGPTTVRRERSYGNKALYYHAVDPHLPVQITMEVLATRRENAGHPAELTAAQRRRYLRAEPLVPLSGPVLALASETTRGASTAAEKARAIFEKVTGMMKYDKSGTGWGRGDAVWACDSKRGNCTDFHSLIIGMARCEGIPARFAIGFPLPEQRGAGEIPGYHCWAELDVDGRWVPVDSSEASKHPEKRVYFFGHHDENRLEFSRGRQIVLNPPQKGAPLNFFVYPYAEVDGKPFDGVQRKFTFADEGTAALRADVREYGGVRVRE